MNISYHKFTVLIFALFSALISSAQELSLEECKALALKQNRKIVAANYNIEAAEAAYEASQKNDLPTVDGSIMGIHLGKPFDAMMPSVIGAASASVAQPIYAGGKIALGKAINANVVELQKSQKNLTEAEVLLNVEKAWWQAIQVAEKVTLAQKYISMLESLHTDLNNAYEAGLIYKNDLLKVDVSLNEAKLNLQKAEDGLTLAKLQLAQLVGRGDSAGFSIKNEISDNTIVLPEDVTNAAAKRPELHLLQKSLDIDQLQTKLIKADLLPTFGISGGGLANLGKQINFANQKDYFVSYYAIASLSIPIFDWGKMAKKVKEQQFKVKAKEESLAEANELIQLEIQHAVLQLKQAEKKITLSSMSLQQAEENIKLANDRFEAGTIVGKDVLEAQAIWQSAHSNLIDAKVEYKIAQAIYNKTIGEHL